ncbi:MAG: hypothetical protein B7Z63_06215 [Ignavibacteriae bacterium 37-53-5]|nr:MAG: hypothetical protein B7Z63_06215 [Ignavibacteriae bacterium 37-53-5]
MPSIQTIRWAEADVRIPFDYGRVNRPLIMDMISQSRQQTDKPANVRTAIDRMTGVLRNSFCLPALMV